MTTLQERIEQAVRQVQDGTAVTGDLVQLLTDVGSLIAQRVVEFTLRNLTYSERQVLDALLDAMPEPTGGRVVLSHITERIGVSRGLAISLIRQLEASGILRSRSLGSQGTMIQLDNGLTVDDLRQHLGGAA